MFRRRPHQVTLEELIAIDMLAKVHEAVRIKRLIREEEEKEIRAELEYGDPGQWADLRWDGDPDRGAP